MQGTEVWHKETEDRMIGVGWLFIRDVTAEQGVSATIPGTSHGSGDLSFEEGQCLGHMRDHIMEANEGLRKLESPHWSSHSKLMGRFFVCPSIHLDPSEVQDLDRWLQDLRTLGRRRNRAYAWRLANRISRCSNRICPKVHQPHGHRAMQPCPPSLMASGRRLFSLETGHEGPR